jgi:UDP-3-O-[3-hydroxymyristoyl] glucosamine N-acyltransferase
MRFSTPYSLAQLASMFPCRVVTVGGVKAEDVVVTGLSTLNTANKDDLSFLINQRYLPQLLCTQARVVLVEERYLPLAQHVLVTDNPRLWLTKLMKHCFADASDPSLNWGLDAGVHSSVVMGHGCTYHHDVCIGPNTVIGTGVKLGAGVVIGPNSVIGSYSILESGVVLHANVTVYSKVSIGRNTVVHSATVIGSEGFGYAQEDSAWVKTPHIGGVMIGDNVEIGANVSIDRGFLEDTVIGDGVVIDNNVQIGHNVKIGNGSALAGCVAIAGSTEIGEHCLIGGGARIVGHIRIADHVVVTAASNVNRSLATGVYSSAFPAKSNQQWNRNVARFNRLDQLAKKVNTLEKKLKGKNDDEY